MHCALWITIWFVVVHIQDANNDRMFNQLERKLMPFTDVNYYWTGKAVWQKNKLVYCLLVNTLFDVK